jgi:hypothetical protein
MPHRPVARISWMAAAIPRPIPGRPRSASGPPRATSSPTSSGSRSIVSAARRNARTRNGFAFCCSRSRAASCSRAVMTSLRRAAGPALGDPSFASTISTTPASPHARLVDERAWRSSSAFGRRLTRPPDARRSSSEERCSPQSRHRARPWRPHRPPPGVRNRPPASRPSPRGTAPEDLRLDRCVRVSHCTTLHRTTLPSSMSLGGPPP